MGIKFGYQCVCGHFFDICLDKPIEYIDWCPACYRNYKITLKIQPKKEIQKIEKRNLKVPDLLHLKSLLKHSIKLIEEKIKERVNSGSGFESLFIPHDFKDISYHIELIKKLNFKIREIRKTYNKRS